MTGITSGKHHRGRTMRRTMKTLMFLAVGGLAGLAQAAEPSRSGNWQYYAAGHNVYRISDDDDSQAAEAAAVAQAVGQPQSNSYDQNALYVADSSAGSGVLQTGFVTGNGDCGCGACGGRMGGCCGCGRGLGHC